MPRSRRRRIIRSKDRPLRPEHPSCAGGCQPTAARNGKNRPLPNCACLHPPCTAQQAQRRALHQLSSARRALRGRCRRMRCDARRGRGEACTSGRRPACAHVPSSSTPQPTTCLVSMGISLWTGLWITMQLTSDFLVQAASLSRRPGNRSSGSRPQCASRGQPLRSSSFAVAQRVLQQLPDGRLQNVLTALPSTATPSGPCPLFRPTDRTRLAQ
jgi:hypothetical protein